VAWGITSEEQNVSKGRLLVVDDEQSILDLVTAYLEKEGFEYKTAMDGQAALRAVRTYKPDIILLDIMLPGKDGLEVLAELRRESDAYVIMLTAKSEETDKIIGLSVGADDYITKPFSPRELIARIKASLRRIREGGKRSDLSILTFKSLTLDRGARKVWMDETEIELTAIEFDLLRVLAENSGLVLSREQILEKVWGYDYYGEIRVVDVHVGHIRQKLGSEDIITTVRGVGYRFEDDPA
jgi:two-component system alkaline phosphatase synthesis response regulator PhoP